MILTLKVFVSIVCIVLPIVFIRLARQKEKVLWNGGFCPQCYREWRSFDTDSQGGRGYKCDACGQHIWISYSVDKRRVA